MGEYVYFFCLKHNKIDANSIRKLWRFMVILYDPSDSDVCKVKRNYGHHMIKEWSVIWV